MVQQASGRVACDRCGEYLLGDDLCSSCVSEYKQLAARARTQEIVERLRNTEPHDRPLHSSDPQAPPCWIVIADWIEREYLNPAGGEEDGDE